MPLSRKRCRMPRPWLPCFDIKQFLFARHGSATFGAFLLIAGDALFMSCFSPAFRADTIASRTFCKTASTAMPASTLFSNPFTPFWPLASLAGSISLWHCNSSLLFIPVFHSQFANA
jgi:hypothetical protein